MNLNKMLLKLWCEIGQASGLSTRTAVIPEVAHAAVLNRFQIWQCATPKSASTYLSAILTDLWSDKFCIGSPIPFAADRYQEPDVYTLYHKIRGSGKPYYSGHLHQRYTSYMRNFFLEKQVGLGGGVIVQTRDVKDTIVSLKDHLDAGIDRGDEGRMAWFAALESWWPGLSDDDKYRLVTYSYAPWHFDFVASWTACPRHIEVGYEQVVRKTPRVVQDICRFFCIKVEDGDIENSIDRVNEMGSEKKRFNIGKSGRGSELLPEDVKQHIAGLQALMGC